MHLPSTFLAILLSLETTMTAPTFHRWITLLAGWLFAPRRTVTGILIAAGVSGKRHHAGFHRFFASARWSLDRLGLAILGLVLSLVPRSRVIFLSLDDTLARKRGRKIFGVGMHHDPLISSRKKAVLNRGHSWVVLSIVVELPFAKGLAYSLPVLFRLYRNKQSGAGKGYRTRPALAVEMLGKLAAAFAGRRFHLLADSAYAGRSVVRHLPAGFEFTGRLHFDARLFARPEPRKKGVPGRTRKRGERLPSPRQLLAGGRGARVTFDLYGRREEARVVTQDCQWYGTLGPRIVRVVAVKPKSGRRPQAFYTTDLEANPIEILRRYSLRWSIEVAFRDSKQCLGFEEPQGWSRNAVLRTAPMAMLLYSLVIVWFAKRKKKSRVALPARPWYVQRRRASFADMLATLKREAIYESNSAHPRSARHVPKSLANLVVHCAGAA